MLDAVVGEICELTVLPPVKCYIDNGFLMKILQTTSLIRDKRLRED